MDELEHIDLTSGLDGLMDDLEDPSVDIENETFYVWFVEHEGEVTDAVVMEEMEPDMREPDATVDVTYPRVRAEHAVKLAVQRRVVDEHRQD